ncbi:MAG: cyclic nucleotide-binding domain-containing protein [SAR324 cluster bacterium]|nr:cyclic nucleotide-binding domain-containing protein [SAR324 cluster bacterium]
MDTLNNALHVLKHESRMLKNVPKKTLEKLIANGDIVEYKSDSVILLQGEVNSNVYFILEGSACVYSNKKFIVKLSRRGDVFGEMSIVSGNPCSATISSDSHLKTLVIDTMDVDTSDDIRAEMYQLFSIILAEKLKDMNKRFETLNQ